MTATLGQAAFAQSVVTGTATYRERIALPPDAVFEATLEDVSRAGAPARVLGRHRIEPAGTPPFRFRIDYDPAQIDPRYSYSVRATVRQGGRLLFTTDTHYGVITRGQPTTVEMLLRRVGGAASGTTGAAGASIVGGLPATFAGTLPCADCPGVDYHLDLHADRTYALRTTYQERKDGAFDDIGRWSIEADGRTLALRGGREAPLFFTIKDSQTLTSLDPQGRPIVSVANRDLRRSPAFAPIEPRLAMRGMFRYMADAALFEECLTGRRLPVMMEGDYLALERAYLGADHQPGEPILAALEGRIAVREQMEGAPRASLVVERYIGLSPGETCAAVAPRRR